MAKLELEMTGDDLSSLWAVIHAHPKLLEVKVPKDILTKLLLDHGKLLKEHDVQ